MFDDDYYCLTLHIDPCDSARVIYRLGHVILTIQKYKFIIQYGCGVLYNSVSYTSQYNNVHYCLLHFGLGSKRPNCVLKPNVFRMPVVFEKSMYILCNCNNNI